MRGNAWSLTNARKRFAHSAVHTSLVFVVLITLVPAAIYSFPLALICVVAGAIATLALIVGLARTGTGFVVLAFGVVSWNDVRLIGSLELSDVFFVTGFMLLAPRLFGNVLRVPMAFIIGGAGLLTIATISALASDQPMANLRYVVLLAFGVVLLPVLLVWWRPGRRAIIAAAAAYMIGNAVNVVNSLMDGGVGAGRSVGLTTHPNVMGLCQLLSLALVPFLVRTLPRRAGWIVGIGAGVSLYGIWISGSRAALSVAVAIALLYPLFRRSIPAALGVAALCLPAIVVLDRESKDPDPSNALGRLLGAGGTGGSNAARESGFGDGFDQFLNHPLLGDGWGLVWGVHNAYLQIAAGIGVFGLAFYVTMLVPILRPLVTFPPPYGLLAVPALAAVMISVVDPALGSRYIWSVIGLVLCRGTIGQNREPTVGTRSTESDVTRPVLSLRALCRKMGGCVDGATAFGLCVQVHS